MSLVVIARCGRPHGLAGEIALDQIWLTIPELEGIGTFVWQAPDEEPRTLRLTGARPMGHRILASFEGFGVREEAQALTNGDLCAPAERVPDAGPGQAYTYQLLGLRMVDTSGREIGVVKDMLRTGAHPVYVVQGARELLVPAVGPIVKRVDLEAGTITVELPAGLEEL